MKRCVKYVKLVKINIIKPTFSESQQKILTIKFFKKLKSTTLNAKEVAMVVETDS